MTTTYHITDIRNIALAGHGASGKTSLADALLYTAGATDRRGSVDDGTSLSDVEDEEKRRHITIDSHLLHLEWANRQIHLIDTPGYPDFIGNALSGLAAVENVITTIAATAGIEVNTRRIFQEAARLRLGRIIALTKMDGDNVDFLDVLEQIRETFGPGCVPFYVPIGQGSKFSGVIDALNPPEDVPDDCPMHPAEAYQMVVEQIVETDEDLMSRYLEGETLPLHELREAACRAITNGQLVPIVCLSARKEIGLKELLDLLSDCSLTPADSHRLGSRADDEVELEPHEDGELIAQVFKTTNDLFMGKLSFLRIHSGRIASDTLLSNLRTGKTSKPGHLYRLQGKTLEEVKEAIAGDIVAVPKFDDLHISDTVTAAGNGHEPHLILKPIQFPTPMVPRAVEPKTREDEPRISVGLTKIADEDPTFTFRRDSQTHELVISGMSELHLDVIQHRLKNRYKLDINTHIPHVPYLETITGEAEAHYRHKKQTGGRGQFADVQLRIRPLGRGEGFRFVDSIKGGVIPGQYVPAVEKGAREQLEKGIVSGNPVVDVEVEVFFGSYHAVDSSEQAFKTAAANAFRKAFVNARPVLLEPIVKLDVVVPLPKFGDVTADLATRRGQITGMEAMPGGVQSIQASVPLSEVLRYATDLKSMTGGQGSFTMEFRSYEPVPPNVQQTIMDRWAKSRAGIEED
ncbi:translation elongation factor 2 (EF-2/EF-G) [Singulisphaera sp. GP187]|uniref:elongation factor G n=1 Tax=Singulisphaera sp. GP187 TaxID=1882752 RepID=UPI000926903C|nr:elongation factor G [Singulisphaera sp. GP187]SIO61001.1 translation elongation factor 2 (EF-2/EF-G) [Singulisphaera sp. GP187]